MSDTINIDNLDAYDVSRTIFVVRGNQPPRFLTSGRLGRCQWPTSAMKVYMNVVDKNFAYFYWNLLEERERERILSSVAFELYLNGNERVYKKVLGSPNELQKLTQDEFELIIKKRLQNLRYLPRDNDAEDFFHAFSPFTKGETVMADSRGSLRYEAVYVYDSVINNSLCYLQFDSRPRPIPWEKQFISPVNLMETSRQRRVTRQTTVRQRSVIESLPANLHEMAAARIRQENEEADAAAAAAAEDNVVEIDNDSSVSSDSDVSTPAFQEGAVATGVPPQFFIDSESEDDDDMSATSTVTDQNNSTENTMASTTVNNNSENAGSLVEYTERPDIRVDYEYLLNRYGDGSENRKKLDLNWLRSQGMVKNHVVDYICPICYGEVKVGGRVYNVKCGGEFRHPLCPNCMKRFVEQGINTFCPCCKFDWAILK